MAKARTRKLPPPPAPPKPDLKAEDLFKEILQRPDLCAVLEKLAK